MVSGNHDSNNSAGSQNEAFKKPGLWGSQAHDLCGTGVVLYQLS